MAFYKLQCVFNTKVQFCGNEMMSLKTSNNFKRDILDHRKSITFVFKQWQ